MRDVIVLYLAALAVATGAFAAVAAVLVEMGPASMRHRHDRH